MRDCRISPQESNTGNRMAFGLLRGGPERLSRRKAMRLGYVSALLVAALLFGCSGGGSTAVTADEDDLVQNYSIGLVRSDAPTTIALEIRKPFYTAATIVLADAPTGAFEPAAGSLPLFVGSGETPTVWIT